MESERALTHLAIEASKRNLNAEPSSGRNRNYVCAGTVQYLGIFIETGFQLKLINIKLLSIFNTLFPLHIN